MNISNVSNSSAVGVVGNVTPNTSGMPSSIPPAPGAAPAQASISKPGQAFGRLQQLSQTDPTQFKAVTSQIADQLHQLAQNETGAAADRANQLADKFSQASQSGDMSSFAPPQGAQGVQGHHHHHGHGGGGGGGGGGAIADVISTALDQVNQTLSASSSGSADASTTSDGTSG